MTFINQPLRFRFDDADRYMTAMRPIARIAPMGRGPFHAELARYWLGDIMLQRADIGQPINATMGMPPAWVVGFGPTSHASERWNGELLEPDHVVLHRPGREAHMVAQGGEWGSVTVQEATLQRIFQERLGRPPALSARQMLRPAPHVLSALRRLHAEAHAISDDAGAEPARAVLRDRLEAALVACLTSTPVGPEDGIIARRGELLSALDDLCAASNAEPLTASRVCRLMGSDERTLKLLCQHVFGMSLHAYVTQWRLRHVHHALRRASPVETSVATEAMRQGFWELGRFAAAYRRAFGQKPSDTLRQAR